MLLTQQGNFLTKPIYIVLGKLFELIFDFLANFGVFNIGICIVIFTLVVKALLFPFSIKQQKSMKINQIIQPEISKIQKKYRGKNDNDSMQRMNMEINAVYKKYGTSMTGGCLTSFIQLPIIWALYRLINNIPAYVSKVRVLYSNMVAAIVASDSNYVNTINDFITNEKVTGYGLEKLSENPTTNQIIDVLSKFNTDNWSAFMELFSSDTEAFQIISTNYDTLHDYNNFMLGINIGQVPGLHFNAYLLIPVLSLVLNIISIKMMNANNKMDKDNPAAGMMKSMNMFMPVMSFVMGVTLPAGLGIYFIASAAFSIFQQIFTNVYFKHVDMDKIIAKNVEKAKKKNKKSFMERMLEMQQNANENYQQYQSEMDEAKKKSISQIANISTKKVLTSKDVTTNNYSEEELSSLKEKMDSNPNSISAKANMMLKYMDTNK
ncbi:MAG: YidC/Oxa1 family membrane protein insertase [Lachnospiraceae bacterium]|nr:YidC/Oxa1 family membrane protein insertase [Lachnospiraceae bacterium]